MRQLSRRAFASGALAAPFFLKHGIARAQGGRTLLTQDLILNASGPGVKIQDAIDYAYGGCDWNGHSVNINVPAGNYGDPVKIGGLAVGQYGGSTINLVGADPLHPESTLIVVKDQDAITVCKGARATISNMQGQTYSLTGGLQGSGFVVSDAGTLVDLFCCSAGNAVGDAIAVVYGGKCRINGGTPQVPGRNRFTWFGSAARALYVVNPGTLFEAVSTDIIVGVGQGFTQGFLVGSMSYSHGVDIQVPNKVCACLQYYLYQAAVASFPINGNWDANLPGTSHVLADYSTYNGNKT